MALEKKSAPKRASTCYLQYARLRNVPPLFDGALLLQPGLNVLLGSPGTGKSSVLRLLEELADWDQAKYSAAGSELRLAGKQRVSIGFHEQNPRKPLTPAARNGLFPLQVEVRQGRQVLTSPSLRHAIPAARLYSVVALGPEQPPAQQPLVAHPVTLEWLAGGELQWLTPDPFEEPGLSYFARALLQTLDLQSGQFRQYLKQAPQVRDLSDFVQRALRVHLDQLTPYLPSCCNIGAVRVKEEPLSGHPSLWPRLITTLVLEYQLNGQWQRFEELPEVAKRVWQLMREVLAADFAYPIQRGQQFALVPTYKLLLLDEPLLGLPWAQQQRLFAFLRVAAGTHQLLLTSDTPHLLDLLAPAELNRLSWCTYTREQGTQVHALSAAQRTAAQAHRDQGGLLSEWWEAQHSRHDVERGSLPTE